MPYRSPARFLAPLALVAAVLAIWLVVNGSLSDSGSSASSPVSTTTTTKQGSAKKRKTYVVKSGDSLSRIAEKTSVELAQILELNPDIDPSALRAGQKLRVRP